MLNNSMTSYENSPSTSMNRNWSITKNVHCANRDPKNVWLTSDKIITLNKNHNIIKKPLIYCSQLSAKKCSFISRRRIK